MTDRIGAVGGTGYVPDEDGMDVLGVGGTAPDTLVDELGSDRAELDGLTAPAASTTTAPPRTPERALADAFVRDGWSGVDAYLDGHPEEVREMVATDRASVAMRIESALCGAYGGGLVAQGRAWWNADAVTDRLETRFTALAHEEVRARASSDIRVDLAALEHTTPAAMLAELRSAAPGSPAAALAEEVGVRGDALDLDRVEAHMNAAREELEMLRDAVEGETWSPDELPGTSTRVMVSMGLGDVAPGSIAFAAFHRDTMPETTRGVVENVYEIGNTSFEVFELAHEGLAISAGAAMGVAVGSIAFGIALHHAIEENRMERREAARGLGL